MRPVVKCRCGSFHFGRASILQKRRFKRKYEKPLWSRWRVSFYLFIFSLGNPKVQILSSNLCWQIQRDVKMNLILYSWLLLSPKSFHFPDQVNILWFPILMQTGLFFFQNPRPLQWIKKMTINKYINIILSIQPQI